MFIALLILIMNGDEVRSLLVSYGLTVRAILAREMFLSVDYVAMPL